MDQYLLSALFVVLFTLPLLIKVVSDRGPYDDIYDALHNRVTEESIGTVADPGRVEDPNSQTGLSTDGTAAPKKESGATRRDPYRLVGSRFAGKYRLERYAGGGGMGAVYYSIQLSDQRPVAVKILKPDIFERNESYAELFDREVQAARRLEHPQIVKVIDSGVNGEDNISFMVMEWLTGETLETVLSHGPLVSLERIVTMITQILEAVAYAHANHVIHLDLKPANVFLLSTAGPKDYIKVIDFGMARILSSETGTTVTRFLGTYQYCSPEHFGGKVTHRSDIYSLGATLYHMLAGVIPFGASYINAKAHPHLELPPVPSLLKMRPDLPKAVDDVVQKALSKNPSDRQDSVKQLLDEFRDAIQL